MRAILLCCTLLACGDAAPTPAPPTAPAPTTATGRLMQVLDRDGDARLSTEEFDAIAHRGQRFSLWDADSDGHLDEAELHVLLSRQSPLLPGYREGGRSRGSDGPANPPPQ